MIFIHIIIFKFASYLLALTYFLSQATDIQLATDNIQPIHSKFRVAIIAGGGLRSFAYVARSWQRYLLSPKVGSVFIFAHATRASKKCELSSVGINILSELATDFDLVSSILMTSNRIIENKLPKMFKGQRHFQSKAQYHGNIVDMWARRSKAYAVAMQYASKNSFEWDLIVASRLDSAFYSPIVNFYNMYDALVRYKQESGTDAIVIPNACAFGAVCDRFAAGLPSTMDVYFREDWIFDVLHWATNPGNRDYKIGDKNASQVFREKNHHGETMLHAWLFLNNITQVYPLNRSEHPVNFFTLRTAASNLYCNSTRTEIQNSADVNWPLKLTSSYAYSGPAGDIDEVRDPTMRCGDAHHLNASELCLNKECSCGPWDR